MRGKGDDKWMKSQWKRRFFWFEKTFRNFICVETTKLIARDFRTVRIIQWNWCLLSNPRWLLTFSWQMTILTNCQYFTTCNLITQLSMIVREKIEDRSQSGFGWLTTWWYHCTNGIQSLCLECKCRMVLSQWLITNEFIVAKTMSKKYNALVA